MLATTAVPSAPVRVSSRRHPAVRAFREAAAHPGSSSSVILDGAHLVRDALAAGVPVRRLIVSSDFLRRAAAEDRALVEAAAATGAAIYHATPAVLEAASPVRTASGLVALADWAAAPVDAAFAPAPALALALIDVQDPGNVGAVVRAADAIGATGVLALDRTAHPAGWKALRGAMGSTFRLPVVRGRASEAIDAARAAGLRILATVADRAASIEQIDFRPSGVGSARKRGRRTSGGDRGRRRRTNHHSDARRRELVERRRHRCSRPLRGQAPTFGVIMAMRQ